MKTNIDISDTVSLSRIGTAFVKEKGILFSAALLLLFLQMLILHISGTELHNTAYITGLTLSLYAVLFCTAFIRYYVRFRSFLKILHQAEIQDVYNTVEEVLLETGNGFTLSQKAALQIISSIKIEIITLKEQTQQLITDQNDYFALWIHQIKTPIASLNLLLQNGNTSTESYFEMQKALIYIENYTQMALHYLKLHGSRQDLCFSAFALDSILQTILRKYRSFFIHKNISLDYEPLHITIVSEAILCEAMIEQIISNSLKYCTVSDRQGSITIRKGNCACDKQEAETRKLIQTLIIEDNGIGIAAADLPKIFDKGYSGLNGRLAGKATGLGLYLAKEIAERINCSLEINSEYRKGTQAIIRFASFLDETEREQ